MSMRHTFLILSLSALALCGYAQERSAKRGLCWDENNLSMNDTQLSLLSPGVSWVYNWGTAPKADPTTFANGDMVFLPMAWNGGFNETAVRNYLDSHPSTKLLLGFNEPNFSSQSNMTPTAAATAWTKLEAIAADYGLELVAPALNFTGESVGGQVWTPYEWYDAFFEAYPTAKVDYLAFHCYMNWAENVDWIASRYFYTEGDADNQNLFYADNAEKYPNLVTYLNNYKEANGHYPQMFLTEFCSWETSVYPYTAGLTVDFQIDQMTQKVQYLEQSDLVAGYAWFMANPSGGASTFPYMSVLATCTASSELSDLGKVYTYMSSFDTEKYYVPGETILAKDYVDATLNDYAPHLRPTTDDGSTSPLQVELPSSGSVTYQINVPTTATYTIRLRVNATADITALLYVDGTRTKTASLTNTGGEWADEEVTISLAEGQHTLLLFNFADDSLLLSELALVSNDTGISAATTSAEANSDAIYTLAGVRVKAATKGVYIQNGKKVVVR